MQFAHSDWRPAAASELAHSLGRTVDARAVRSQRRADCKRVSRSAAFPTAGDLRLVIARETLLPRRIEEPASEPAGAAA